MSDISFNLNPSFVSPAAAPAETKPGTTGPAAPPSAVTADGKALGEVRKGAIPATGDRLSLTVSPTDRGGEVHPPDTALLNAIEKLILQSPQKLLASSIGLSVTLAAAIKEAPGIVHHGEPDEDQEGLEVPDPEEDGGSLQMPRLRRAGMRLSRHSKDEDEVGAF